MGSKYKSGYNPILDYLMHLISSGCDVSNPMNKEEIYKSLVYILEFALENKNHIVYLDIEIIGDSDNVVVKGNNIISALWLLGIFPIDVEYVLNNNIYVFGNYLYHFNNETKILTNRFIFDA